MEIRCAGQLIKREIGCAASTTTDRAASFSGSRRAPLKYSAFQTVRNEPMIINNRMYSGHALDKMQDRGLLPSIVENTIEMGKTFPTKTGTVGYYNSIENVRVIVNSNTGQVITTIPGAP